MGKVVLFVVLSFALLAFKCFADDYFTSADEKIVEEIKQTFPYTAPHVRKVEKLKAEEVYQVVAGNNVLYYLKTKDGKYKYLMFGGIFTHTGKNLTEEKLAEIRKEAVSNNLKDLVEKRGVNTVKVGNGKGRYEVYAFISTRCPHCKNFYNFIKSKKDVTSYFFIVDQSNFAKAVLCGAISLDDLAREDVTKSDAVSLISNCSTDGLSKAEKILKENLELSRKMGAFAVPYVIIVDEKTSRVEVIRGADVKKIEEFLKGEGR